MIGTRLFGSLSGALLLSLPVAVIGFLLAAPAARGDLVFDNPVVPYGLFEQSFHIASGDVNGDGTADLISGNYYGYDPAPLDLVVHLGLGGGEFGAALHVAQHPAPLWVADLDADGMDDVTLARCGGNSVIVLFSAGDGTFSSPHPLPVGSCPSDLLVTDLTADGTLDLACPNYGSHDASVILGLGGRAFEPERRFPAGRGPNAIASADFDADRRADLAFAHRAEGTVSLLHGDGAGNFSAAGTFPAGFYPWEGPETLACEDLDGDSWGDCVAGSWGASHQLLRNDGSGVLSPTESLLARGRAALADMTGDGTTDVLASWGWDWSWSWYSGVVIPGVGDGTFLPGRSFGNGGGGLNFTVNDFNGDGTRDMAFANDYQETVSVLFGNGDGTSGRKLPAGRFPYDIATADFNGDGLPDLATANEDSFDVSIFLAAPEGGFLPSIPYPVTVVPLPAFWPVFFDSGDLDGDGDEDIAVGDWSARELRLLRGDGSGGFAPPASVPLARKANALAIAEVTGDGLEDLILGGIFDTICVLPSLGNGAFGPEIVTPGGGSWQILVADLDLDGKADLLTRALESHVVVPMMGNGDGTFRPAPPVPFRDPHGRRYPLESIATGDLNSDGVPDLVMGGEGAFSVAPGAGDGTFCPLQIYARPRKYHLWTLVADFTLDGTADVALEGGAGDLALYSGVGGGLLAFQGAYNVGDHPYAALPIDADHDGRLDVALPVAYENKVALLINRVNRPPVARSGEDQAAECGDPVVLDGSASSDPDSPGGTTGEIVSYLWFEDFGSASQRLLAEGVEAAVALPAGLHRLTLRVSDRRGATDMDELLVTVTDTLPPAGAITGPFPGSCLGAGALPAAVTDDFIDHCEPVVSRDYSPAPDAGPGLYIRHGDHEVTLIVMDSAGHAASDSVAFTIDLEEPLVRILPPPPLRPPWTAPRSWPFASGWTATDDDGASGGVVREVLFWDGCPVFDGSTWGTTKDGLLSNESVRLDRTLVCRAMRVCGKTSWLDPVLKVEVWDCGGSSGSDQIVVPGLISAGSAHCATESPRSGVLVPVAR